MMAEAEITRLIVTHGLWLLFVLTLIEGPVATLAGAAMAGRGLLDPLAVFAVAFAGDLVGDGLLYAIGRLSPALTRRLGGGRGDAVPARHGGWHETMHRRSWQIIALGKLTHVAGFAVILAAGAARVPFGLFLGVSALATLPKVAVLVLAGWALGRVVDVPWIVALAALAVFLAGLWALRVRRVP
jgi:membrane protein DedA with SNARE-associated domain